VSATHNRHVESGGQVEVLPNVCNMAVFLTREKSMIFFQVTAVVRNDLKLEPRVVWRWNRGWENKGSRKIKKLMRSRAGFGRCYWWVWRGGVGTSLGYLSSRASLRMFLKADFWSLNTRPGLKTSLEKYSRPHFTEQEG
jgi:hypothetical protein